jgi:hypothetical protein
MRSSTVLLLGLSSAISLGLADVCQAETFTGRYIIVSETSDIGGSISGYIVFEDAIISNKLALPHEYDRGVKEVSITYSQPGMGTMTVDLSDYKAVLTPVFHNPISTSASWEFYGDLMGDGEIKDTLKLSVFNVDGDPSTPGQTRWTVMIDDVSNSPDLGTDWALRTFSPVWWLVLDTDSDDKSPAIANAKQNGLDNGGNKHAR